MNICFARRMAMAVHYYCRHCAAKMGTIEDSFVNEQQLGINVLTEDEKHEMIAYDSKGDIHIQAICDNCHEALTNNPDLHQYDYLIH